MVNITAEYTRLNGTYRLLPAPQPQKLAPKPLNASLYAETPEIYSSTSPYPARPYDYEVKHGIDPTTLERVTYLIVRIYPVQYMPATGQIYYATSVKHISKLRASLSAPNNPNHSRHSNHNPRSLPNASAAAGTVEKLGRLRRKGLRARMDNR